MLKLVLICYMMGLYSPLRPFEDGEVIQLLECEAIYDVRVLRWTA